LQDDFSDPLIFSGAAVPPPVPWNVDETLFEIVAAVPDQDAVRRKAKTIISDTSQYFSEDNDLNTDILEKDYDSFYDNLNCQYDCVTQFCDNEDESCDKRCSRFCEAL